MAEKKPKDKKPKAKKPKAEKAEKKLDELTDLTPEPKFADKHDAKDEESELDGCDVELTENDVALYTLDEDLPKTEGGVA